MKARLAKKILKRRSLYWIRHYLGNDHRCDKALLICRRKNNKIAHKLGRVLLCKTCKWTIWKETDHDVYRDCSYPRQCLYCNRWEPLEEIRGN